MTAVTQIIPNYLGGVSRQPDEKKSAGQVKDILNGYPDPVYGLAKRNGLEFLNTLSEDITGLDDAAWFFINRDKAELYIACVTTTGTLRIWDILGLREIPAEDITFIGDSKDYLGNGLDWTDFKFLTVQDSTMVVNKTTTVLQDYGKDINRNYLVHPDEYIPNNVATIKVLSVEYNTEYEIIIKSNYFQVEPIKITSAQQPDVDSNAKLQTASEILELLAKGIPTEFFDVTVLNTSMELKSKQITGGAIDDKNDIALYQDSTGSLYFVEDGEETYITINTDRVPYYYFGDEILPASILRDGSIVIAFRDVEGKFLRIATINNDGTWDATYTTVEKIPATPAVPPTGGGLGNGGTDGTPEVPEDATAYWAEEDRFNNDFDDDRFVGNPDEEIRVEFTYNLVVSNTETGENVYKDQYGAMWFGPLSNPYAITQAVFPSQDPPYSYIAPNGVGSGFGFNSLLTNTYNGPSGLQVNWQGYSKVGKNPDDAHNWAYYFGGGSVNEFITDEQDPNVGEINPEFYEVESGVFQDFNGDGFIGDPTGNPPVPAPIKPIVNIPKGAPFTIEVKAGRDGEALDAYQSEIEDGARLAATSIQGRRVKVLNTADDKSSYFVQFVANDPNDPIAGNGFWEEDLGWEEYDGNKDVEPYIALASYGTQLETMPHILKVPEPGKFEFSTYPFDERLVGSELSNPSPSYVNKKINHVFLDNNRLGFLSGENVILSQSGEFGNFYFVSAKTTIQSDPIDLNCSSIRPANLHSTLPNAQGLVLFSKFEQFIMFSESGTLKPGDAVIRSISNYENDTLIPPVDVGTSSMFLNKTPGQTRTMGMITRGLSDNPIVVDISKVITDYVPNEIDVMTTSPQNSFIALSSKSTGDIYFYRFFNDGEKDIMQAWFRWEVPGKVQGTFIAQDSIFIVTKDDNGYQVLQSPLSQSTSINDELNIKLDNFFSCNDSRLNSQPFVYDKASDLTKLPKLYTIPTTGDYIAYTTSQVKVQDNAKTVEQLTHRISYVNTGNDFVGGGFITPIVIKGNDWYIKGDWTGNDPEGIPWRDKLIIGKLYNLEVDLPSTYFRPAENVSDYTASLTLARYRFSLGESGNVNFLSKAKGSDEWTMVGAVSDANYYNADTPVITNETILTVPIYQRNKNFDFKIQADTPLPVSIISMMWEGKYVPRNYRRS